jgi:hypothetical protein
MRIHLQIRKSKNIYPVCIEKLKLYFIFYNKVLRFISFNNILLSLKINKVY